MVRVLDLSPGDILIGFMKPGFALVKQRRADTGELFLSVPSKPDRSDKDDLSTWVGSLQNNDKTNHILSLTVSARSRYMQIYGEAYPVQIHYLALSKLERVSKQVFAPRPQDAHRPTQIAIGTGNFPYRTCELVQLTW